MNTSTPVYGTDLAAQYAISDSSPAPAYRTATCYWDLKYWASR